ncbi:dihydroorotase [Patescibacteria group bacterium]|nr:dihydroorotase [Patescibacteria group bacterium]
MNKIRIDPHVHFRDAEQNYKETIAHGLSVANDAGVSYVFDMPNTLKPILRQVDVVERLKLVPENKKKNYFLYIGATSDEGQLKEAISLVNDKREVIGMKMYAGRSTGNLAIIKEEEQRKVYKVLSENGYEGVIVVHCEKESYMKELFDPRNPYTHALSRPKIAEVESVKDQIKFAKEYNFKGTLHIAHISCAESIELVNEAKKEIKITCGITPHHLIWSDDKLKESNGNLYKMNPPLRDEEEVKKLQELLKQDKVDWIETDHAPHTVGEKLHKGFPSGYPTLYIYREFIEEFLPSLGISEEQIDRLTLSNIINTFNLEL